MDRDTAVRTIFKGGVAVLMGSVFELGFSFAAKIILARYLDLTAYGSVVLGASLLTFVASLAILGLGEGLARFIPRFDDERRQRGVFRAGLMLGMPLPIVIGTILIVWPEVVAVQLLHAPAATPLFPIFGAILPVTAFVYLGGSATRGLQWSVPRVTIQHFAIPISRFVFIITAVLLGAGAFGMAGAYALPFVVAAVLTIYFLWKTPLLSGEAETRQLYQDLLRFSLPLALTAITALVLADIDLFLLSRFRTTAEVGTYDVVYSLGMLIMVGLASLGFLFLPVISELHANDQLEDMGRVYQISAKWITMITLPIALILGLFPEMSIKITFGTAYAPGATTLSILTIGFFVASTVGTNSEVLQSAGRTKFIAGVNATAAVLNVGLNLLLIPSYGTVGAAVATVASMVFINGSFTLEVYRQFGIHPFSRAMIRPAVIALGLIGAIYYIILEFLGITPVIALTMGVVFTAVYGLVVLRFGGIESEEVMILNSAEERLGVDLGPVKKVLHVMVND